VPARTLRHSLALALLAALAAAPATLKGQTSQTGILQGRVSLPSGRVIANATVALRQLDGSYPRGARSDQRGDFRINFITPGVYEVSVRLIGYQPVVYNDVVIRATEVTRLDIELTPSRTVLDALTVSAGATNINTSTTEFTTSLQAKERELLPTARDANSLINFTPGARPNQLFGGSTGQANLYQLDGVTVNQPGTGGSFLLPNIDWIQDFKVIGLGAGAEYGNFQGGLVNIVTKSGSNTLQGQVRTFYENRALNASNVNAFENGSELDNRVEFNAELRGPIIADRLYFYLSGQEARSGNRVVDFANATSDNVSWLSTLSDRREQKYYGKLTWQASERDIINASAGIDNVTRERAGLSGYDAVDATYQGRSPSTFYQANWQRTLSNRSFLELKLSGYSGEDNETPYNGSNVPAVVLLDAPNTPQFANAFYTRRNAPASLGFTGVYDAYFNTGLLQHNLKLGGDHTQGSWRERRTRNGDYTWYTEAGAGFDPLNPATWQEIPSLGVYATTDTGGRIDLDATTQNSALYVQDYIRVSNRLSLSAGLRLGRWAGDITPGNGGGSRGKESFRAVTATALDPRLGATFDVNGDASLVAKAHWGRFHQNLFALFFDRAPGANVFTNIEFCDWNNTDKTLLPELGRQYTAAQFASLFSCFPGANLFNEASAIENYRQPYMDQITLGLEKTIGRNLKAEVLYINRRNRDVLSLVDKNLAQNWSPISNVRVLDSRGAVLDANGQPLVLPTVYVRNDDLANRLSAGDQIPGYVDTDTLRLRFEQDLVIRPVDDARRDFNQLQFSVAGTYPRLQFNAALAYTRLTGNLYSVNGYFNPSGQENGPFVEQNGQLNFSGNLPNYSPWDFKLRMSGQLPWGFEGGAFLTYTSGDFWTPSLNISRQLFFDAEQAGGGTVELDERLFRGAVGQDILTEPRGSRQFAALANLDLRLQRVFRLGTNDVIVGLEVFNLTNGNAITALKQELNAQDPADPTSLVGAVRFRQPPTTLRLNLQYRL
jgi:hypothetical protein